jgi:nitrate reductase NapA
MFGKSKATMSLWTMGLNQRVWGTWINNLMYNLHLITGKICKPGNTALSMTGQPNACGGAREQGMLSHLLPAHRVIKKAHHREEMEKIWGVPKGSISPTPGMHTLKMFEEVGKKIKLIWIACSNPYQTLPDLDAFIKNTKDAFIIVQDIFPPTSTQDEDKFPHVTAELADLFIPSAFWIEKGGVFGNTERRSGLTERMIKPPKGLLTDAEIFIEVAKRMGKGEYFKYKNHEDLWNEYILSSKGTDLDLSGANYDYLRKHESAQWPILNANEGGSKLRYQYPDDKYLKKMVEEGKIMLHSEFIKEEEEKKKKIAVGETIKEDKTKKKVIPADNIYFYGQANEGRAKVFLRPQKDAAELPNKEYPLFLTTGRVVHHWHTGTMTMRVPWLEKMAKHAYIEINIVDAQKMGIRNEDLVKVTTKRGSLNLRAKVVEIKGNKMIGADEKISIPRPGVIFAPFFDARLLVNKLTINAYDAMSKEPEYKIAAAKIEKINEVV